MRMGCRYICKPELRDTTVDAIQAVAVKIEDKKLMSRILPALPSDSSLAHCRRVHNGFILIGAMDDAEKQSRDVLEKFNCKSEFSFVCVPRFVPLTKKQYEFCQSLWPVRFKEDKELERKLNGTYFPDDKLSIIQSRMAEAYESDECIITTTNFNIVGRASESQFSRDKPLKHPFMRAFDHLTHSHAVGIKRSISGEEYIGTDCLVFVCNEPCAMCAMAMVHGRVKTVFFAKSTSVGAFESTCQLHLKSQLNHHYEIFQLC